MNNLTTILLMLLFSGKTFAWNAGKCTTYLNEGLYQKYEYQGFDQPATKATKKHGSTQGSTKMSTETSTASLDPVHWTHLTASVTQGFSSWGPCSGLGLKQMREHREKYIVQNKEEILKEISKGQGEHLNVLASFSLCEDKSVPDFSSSLQKRMNQFIDKSEKTFFGDIIDASIRGHLTLRAQCLSLS